ncbi:MAG TPA: cytochrome c-type biogenesis protein [Burkholderiales bacterium]|nr:cytochrome c-type biogenesis protein [Burkholderiales bacterium]
MRLLLFLLILFPGAGIAQSPEVEERVKSLAEELRCLVCQNQTLADSNAPLAVDLRNQIREQVQAGASDEQVVDFMVARYGDFVRYRPPFTATTFFLWVGPFLFLIAGAILLLRRVTKSPPEAPGLSDEDRARAAKLLE